MNCFCFEEVINWNTDALSYPFEHPQIAALDRALNPCKVWWDSFFSEWVMMMMISVALVVLNMIMREMVKCFTDCERHHTKTIALTDNTIRVILVYYLNTAITPIVGSMIA
jgi:hypothetical protein